MTRRATSLTSIRRARGGSGAAGRWGGFLSAAFREFDPENLWNVELGYKAKVWRDRLEVRAALFRMQRRDVQISTSRTVAIAGQPGAEEFIVYTGNAADGFNQGLELEATLQLTEQLTAFTNIGLLDSEYSIT